MVFVSAFEWEVLFWQDTLTPQPRRVCAEQVGPRERPERNNAGRQRREIAPRDCAERLLRVAQERFCRAKLRRDNSRKHEETFSVRISEG